MKKHKLRPVEFRFTTDEKEGIKKGYFLGFGSTWEELNCDKVGQITTFIIEDEQGKVHELCCPSVFRFTDRDKQPKKEIPKKDIDRAIFLLPTKDKSQFPITNELLTELKTNNPNADVEAEITSMIDWLNANPTRKKTVTGMRRFINSWLGKANKNTTQSYSQQKSTSGLLNKT